MASVVLGLSGGVDSAVAVHLLQQSGYEVIGVHMQMIPEAYLVEQSTAAIDAQLVAEQFGIPFYVLDVRERFNALIINYFVEEYNNGRTPNPCIYCNALLKFQVLAEFAEQNGIDYLATGHYAVTAANEDGQVQLKKGHDAQKDQSYFLFRMSQDILDRVIFPLGFHSKEDIRAIAAGLGLKVAQKPDSQEVCFIPNDDYKAFLLSVLGKKAFKQGHFINAQGEIIGKHQGIQCYTIGQRKGLGIALGYPAYVTGIDAPKNTITLGLAEELQHNALVAQMLNFLVEYPEDTPIAIEAKIRYRAKAEPATLTIKQGTATVVFDTLQRAITPGQGVCFYQGDVVIGGGTILYGQTL